MESTPGLHRYRVYGRAYPERGAWWFDRFGTELINESGLQYRLQAEMTGSQFSAILEIRSDEPPDYSDVKVHVETNVRTALDTIGLLHGCAVDCEVVQMELPSGESFVLDSSFSGLRVNQPDEEFTFTALTAFVVRGLRLGLADFRMAIRSPVDTAFLSYRGLDGIRADLGEREQIDDEIAQWDRMREVTRLDKGALLKLKDQADPRRHGSEVPLTHDERAEALRLLQAGLLNYRDWCLKNLDEVVELVRANATGISRAADEPGE